MCFSRCVLSSGIVFSFWSHRWHFNGVPSKLLAVVGSIFVTLPSTSMRLIMSVEKFQSIEKLMSLSESKWKGNEAYRDVLQRIVWWMNSNVFSFSVLVSWSQSKSRVSATAACLVQHDNRFWNHPIAALLPQSPSMPAHTYRLASSNGFVSTGKQSILLKISMGKFQIYSFYRKNRWNVLARQNQEMKLCFRKLIGDDNSFFAWYNPTAWIFQQIQQSQRPTSHCTILCRL